ncbi:MAG: hypothetical protein JXP36_03440, partial [Bacteroidales bacterium]|nr:hypothetical protein [Bacteroidales bacterium]
IYYHFVRNRCIFDDGVFSGTNATHLINSIVGEQIVYETLSFSNAVHSLSITDGSGQTITVDHDDANKLMEFGVIHKINTVLQK